MLVLAGGQNYLHVCHHSYQQQPPLLSVTSSMLLTSGERVRRLQEQCEARIEHLVRKTTSLAKVIFKYLHNIYTISTISPHLQDPVCRALVSLSEDQQRVAEQVAAWVEPLPPRVLTDIFNRVLR